MSACEECWSEASRRAWLTGKTTAEVYPLVLAENDGKPGHGDLDLRVCMREAIAVLRPSLVVWENVRGASSAKADSAVEFCEGCVGAARQGRPLRALGRVLGDLADLGYDAEWCGVRASDVGAPHQRFRFFVTAHPAQQ